MVENQDRSRWITRRRIATTGIFVVVALLVLISLFQHNRRDPEIARQLRAGTRMRLGIIGRAIQLYRADHDGHFPDNFGQLITEEKLTPDNFLSWLSEVTPATGLTTQAVADNLAAGGHSSFVYLGKGMSNQTPPNAIAAYAPAHNGGMLVLYANSEVDWLSDADIASSHAELKTAIRP